MTAPDIACDPAVTELVRAALAEDIGAGDATTAALVAAGRACRARIVARGRYVVSGMGVAGAVFRALDAEARFTPLVADCCETAAGAAVAEVAGRARAILAGERTALNFLQRLTGIATLTRRFVEEARPFGVTILDTRKTTPTLRLLEKYAVRCGGGVNHRAGLYDRILIKDNHRRLWTADAGGAGARRDLASAVRAAREARPGMQVEIEVENEHELSDALGAGPDWILLDNMAPERIRRCVALCGGRCRLEASGGITLDNVADVAAAGVDAISLGCLTHSAPAADFSMEVEG